MREEEIILLGRIRKGDEGGFKILFDRYYRRLYLYALSYLEDPDASEDLVQELFLRIWEKRERLKIDRSISSYLFTSIHHCCIQHIRKQKVREAYQYHLIIKLREMEVMLSHSMDFSFNELDYKETQVIIDRTFARLPVKTREVFRLSRKENLSNREIAKKKKISIKTVEYHLANALKSFRKALNQSSG